MDESKVSEAHGGHGYTGAVVEHRRLAGAHVSRIMHPPGQRIEAHGHDWPVLTLYRIGGYRERSDDGEVIFDGPSVVFQPGGASHEDDIGEHGLETLAMTFDPVWLTAEARAAMPSRTYWAPGGPVAAAARALANVWLAGEMSAADVRARTSAFVISAFRRDRPCPKPPLWADRLAALEHELSTKMLAERLAKHPAWLARAYRAWRGEGIAETIRRRRVERAVLHLRGGAAPLADVAVGCGFCDQSHMNRLFRAVLGRTPAEVRREAALLAPLMQPA